MDNKDQMHQIIQSYSVTKKVNHKSLKTLYLFITKKEKEEYNIQVDHNMNKPGPLHASGLQSSLLVKSII